MENVLCLIIESRLKIENPETKFKKIHFYAFGGIKKTTDWLKTVNKHDLSYNGQKFQ